MSDLPRVQGEIVDEGVVEWDCPTCGNKAQNHFSQATLNQRKRRKMPLEFKKLCKECPPGVFTWAIVEVKQ